MGTQPFLVAASLEGILAQRLLRTICPDCQTPYEPSETILTQLGVSPHELGDKNFYTGKGCKTCGESGYKGRAGLYELLNVTDPIRELIIDRAPSVVVKQKAVELGMTTLREDGDSSHTNFMANFQYIALDSKGEQTTGVVQANSDAEAVTMLRGQGLYPTQVVEEGKGSIAGKAGKKGKTKSKSKAKGKGKGKVGGKVKPKVLMIFTRQLATLIDSGLPLLRGLNVLGKQEPNPVLQATITNIADSVQGGSTFSESLGQHPKMFNKLYVNMVKPSTKKKLIS